MFGWRAAIAVAASAAIFLTLLIAVIVRRCFHFSKRGTKVTGAATPTPPENRGKTELRQSQRVSSIENRPRSIQPVFQPGSSTKHLFDWSDHPSLITDVVENGWSRFAFVHQVSPQSTTSTLLGCVGDLNHHHQYNQRETHVEMTWEVREKSLDFMQKIRMNSGLKKFSSNSSSMAAKSVIRTALPLPGPLLGTTSFPQEAYFEITILSVASSSSSSSRDHKIHRVEGEKTKLIQDNGLQGKKRSSDSIINVVRSANHHDGERTSLMMSVGLTSFSHVPLKVPGSYHGSIGLNSDGSVYLDGMKLFFGSGKESWGEQKVIGCGFNPLHEKVFFTADSELTHSVSCKSGEFSSTLYPVIAANADITVLVNMGQSSFSYEPANAARTPNPCFIGSIMSSPTTAGYEDSDELFSMAGIDSGWLNHSATKINTNSDVYSWCKGAYYTNSNGISESKENEDDESEDDLFEIVLDVNGSLQMCSKQ